MTEWAWVLLAACVLDLTFGEPPNVLHPVAWMGRAIAWVHQPGRRRTPAAAFLLGSAGVLGGGAAVTMIAWVLPALLTRAPAPVRIGAEAVLLKAALSLRRLLSAAEEVRRALEDGDLPEARRRVGLHLVSRPTEELAPDEVAGATVESLAENLTDAVVGPLLWFVLLGIPGALAYRFVNTADAMLGYRDPEREWLGKPAARLDDLLNWVPARLAAGILLASGWLFGCSIRDGLRVWRRDAGTTASPNAGQTMAALAGLLGVRLTKRGQYALGDPLCPLTAETIVQARRLVGASMALAVGCGIGALVLPGR
jgi:adenosylcobinamide-phosphate synthase